MLSYAILAGSVDVSVVIRIVDSVDGTPETGVVFNTAGIDLQYRREGAASTAIVEATLAALTTAHTDGGFLHIGNGYYRLDLPDAAVAAGASGVLVHGTVTGMVVIGSYIQLVAYNPQDAVRLGLSALPNANAGANGGLPTIDANLRVSANVTAITDALLTAAKFATGAFDAVWSVAARLLTAGTNIVLAKGVGVTGFNDLSAAQVNAEVVDALNVDTYAEPGQATPPATTTLQAKLSYLYKAWRNRHRQTTTAYELYGDDAITVHQRATFASSASDADRGEIATGP